MATNTELDEKLVDAQEQAQEAPPAPNVTIEVNVNELNLIFAALQELPHKVVDPVLRKVFAQAQAQLQVGQ